MDVGLCSNKNLHIFILQFDGSEKYIVLTDGSNIQSAFYKHVSLNKVDIPTNDKQLQQYDINIESFVFSHSSKQLTLK